MNMESLVKVKPNPKIPTLTSGDTVKVSNKVVEGDKERTQVFQGVVIRVRHSGASSSFTVRRVTYGFGVERTFPIYSPRVEKVEMVRHGKVRRAKLYYLRELSAKASRIKERRLSQLELEREREEAQKLEQERALEQKQGEAAELEQQPEPKQKQVEAAELEQQPEPEQKQAETADLEQPPEAEQEQMETAELEQPPEPEKESD